MRDLIATASYTYAGQRLKAGDTFTATDSDANLLTIVGKAKAAGPTATKLKKPAATKRAPKKQAAPKGTYARRDMRAEG